MASSRLVKMGSMKKQSSRGLDSTLINPKNSKPTWLQRNLQEMEEDVKIILKFMKEYENLIDKKSVMFYSERFESIGLVQKCHYMYLSLAERYIKETRVGIRSNILSNHNSQVSATVVGSGFKQLKRILSSKCRRSNHGTSDQFIDSDCAITRTVIRRKCAVDLHDNDDIVEKEFVPPFNHETNIEDETNLSLEEEQVMAGETEIENSEISISDELVIELIEALETTTQMYLSLAKQDIEETGLKEGQIHSSINPSNHQSQVSSSMYYPTIYLDKWRNSVTRETEMDKSKANICLICTWTLL